MSPWVGAGCGVLPGSKLDCQGSCPEAEGIAPARRHLRDLLRDAERSDMLYEEHNKIIADFSRQRVTKKTLEVCCAGAMPVSALSVLPVKNVTCLLAA